jgi:hypothetical protein
MTAAFFEGIPDVPGEDYHDRLPDVREICPVGLAAIGRKS